MNDCSCSKHRAHQGLLLLDGRLIVAKEAMSSGRCLDVLLQGTHNRTLALPAQQMVFSLGQRRLDSLGQQTSVRYQTLPSICSSSVKMPSLTDMPAVNIQGMCCDVYLQVAVAAAASLRKKSR